MRLIFDLFDSRLDKDNFLQLFLDGFLLHDQIPN
jgi:hypothetical protein